MGANAQTSVPVFTIGQVLTAQQQTEINTGIPVFADSTARDAAFGGTGEKTLAEGQFAFLEDTDTTQYYDGSTWNPVGVAPGLVFITGASFSAVTSVSLPTDTFSSTYENYLVSFNLTTAVSTATMTLRLRASGTDVTSGDYQNMLSNVTNINTSSIIGNNSQTSFNYGTVSASTTYNTLIQVRAPKLAQRTNLYTNQFFEISGTSLNSVSGAQCFGNTNQCDSLTLISSVASNITGTYTVYGYANS